MNTEPLHDGDVVVRQYGALRRVTLNRPKALNAITLAMAETMTALLRRWVSDPTVGAVLLDGAGERGFCAGGDIRALYDSAKSGGALGAEFWATEYRLNLLIARYPKPVIAVMDGLVMGGGVGLSAHAAHRIVTERSAIAMPEVGIGFFPDVGASFLLARAPGHLGTYLALTGQRIGAADAIHCGLADIYVPAATLGGLAAALGACTDAAQVQARLADVAVAPPAGTLAAARAWIDDCYSADTVEAIVARLSDATEKDATAALSFMRKASPTSLKIALRNQRAAAAFGSVEQSFRQDYRIALACIAGHDFMEGIRAAVVDKDRKPVWRPDKIEDVTAEIVDRHFRSIGACELKLDA
jgi:enoyl-CoA hydratase